MKSAIAKKKWLKFFRKKIKKNQKNQKKSKQKNKIKKQTYVCFSLNKEN